MGKIKGSVYKTTKKDTIFAILIEALFSFFLFGEYMLRPFLIIVLVYMLIKYIGLFLKNKTNYIIFVEENGEILLAGKKSLKIEDMQIIIKNKKKYFNIVYHIDEKDKDLVTGVEKKYLSKLENHLKESGKKYAIETNVKREKKIFLFGVFILSIIGIYLIQLNYLRSNIEASNQYPIELDIENIQNKSEKKIYQTDRILLALPAKFMQIKDDNGNDFFLSKTDNEKITVLTQEKVKLSENNLVLFLLKNVLGVDGNYTLIDKSNRSKYGLIYIIFRSILNQNIDSILYVEKGDCNIYIQIVQEAENKTAIIQVFEKTSHLQTDIIVETDNNLIQFAKLIIAEIVTL